MPFVCVLSVCSHSPIVKGTTWVLIYQRGHSLPACLWWPSKETAHESIYQPWHMLTPPCWVLVSLQPHRSPCGIIINPVRLCSGFMVVWGHFAEVIERGHSGNGTNFSVSGQKKLDMWKIKQGDFDPTSGHRAWRTIIFKMQDNSEQKILENSCITNKILNHLAFIWKKRNIVCQVQNELFVDFWLSHFISCCSTRTLVRSGKNGS